MNADAFLFQQIRLSLPIQRAGGRQVLLTLLSGAEEFFSQTAQPLLGLVRGKVR